MYRACIQDTLHHPLGTASPLPKSWALLCVRSSYLSGAQVSKKSFADAVSLLHREHRPTRLVFVRHACGRRFVRREKCGSCGGKTQQSSCPTPFGRWSCGKRGNGGCGCQLAVGSAQVGHAGTNPSPRKSKKLHHQIEVRARQKNREGGLWIKLLRPVCDAASWCMTLGP